MMDDKVVPIRPGVTVEPEPEVQPQIIRIHIVQPEPEPPSLWAGVFAFILFFLLTLIAVSLIAA